MNLDPTVLASLGTIFSIIAIAVSLLRNNKASSMEHIERLIQYQNSQFSATLDDKLDKKFEDLSRETNRRFEELGSRYIDKGTMDLRLQMLLAELKNDREKAETNFRQIDHRTNRNTEQISMLLDAMLKNGLRSTTTVIKEATPGLNNMVG
jgi:hypothetical protein